MPITLSNAFRAELNKGSNTPNVIIEIAFDSGTRKFGFHDGGFPDVQPILKDVSSLQNKISASSGFATRGKMVFTISGRDIIKRLVFGNYMDNRRVIRKDGFVAGGFAYSDYATTYTGKITGWSRDGDELTIEVADDMTDGQKKIPVENERKTQYIDYSNTNAVDVMTDILSTQLAISTVYIDSTQFTAERDLWMLNFVVNRVITKPKKADDYLNELQMETNSYILHDGNQISYKVFSPKLPGQTYQSFSDANNILDGSVSQDSGYKDQMFNRVIVQYDYDESGNDKWENYQSIYIIQDTSSINDWGETNTKEIKSKWLRSRGWGQPSALTGVTIYHISIDNAVGSGTLNFISTSSASTYRTLSWTAPGGSEGAAVNVAMAGQFQLFDSDTSKSIRVIVESSSLPATSSTEAISVNSLNGGGFAAALAGRHLSRYKNPISDIKLSVDLNEASYNGVLLKPTDVKNITTDEAFSIDSTSFTNENMMITSMRIDPKDAKIDLEAIQTKLSRNYGFIAPAGYPDYSSATGAQKEYAFISNSSGELGGATSLAYYIW